jgi:aryl-alcohol dehydrogenase-like predicted oxidoreductase
VGATKPGHLEDAAAAVELQLADDEVLQLEQNYIPHSIEGF